MKYFARSIFFSMLGVLMMSGSALSHEQAPGTLRDALAQKGVTKISDGLYVVTTDTDDSFSESYVAIGEAGQQALLSKLLQMRDANTATASRQAGAALASESDEPLDDLIERLSASTAGSNPTIAGTGGPFRGNCGGIDNTNNPSDPFYLQAVDFAFD